MISDKEILQKAERNEDLTEEEVKRYQEIVPPVRHVYGKYGSLALRYLENHNPAKMWAIEDLPTYLHNIDKQAEEMDVVLREKLSLLEQYRRTGNFMEDLQRLTAKNKAIEEEILNELVYI